MRLVIAFLRNQRGTMVADVAKAGAAIAFLSVIAANLVSNQLDRDAMRQASQAAAKGQSFDPLVTGSIIRRAGETKLDPCVVQR